MGHTAKGATPTSHTTTKLPGVILLRRRAERYERQRHAPAVLPDFVPDALKDTKSRRKKKALKLFGDGDGLASRLWLATDGRSQLVTVKLGSGTAADLYSHQTNKHARKVSRAVFGDWPVQVKLELGLDGGLHLHMLGHADAPLMLPRGSNVEVLQPGTDDFQRVLGYLSKPGDARACMVKLASRRYAKPDSVLLAAAIQDYEAARAVGRLPRLSWSHNVPRLKPDAVYTRPA